MSCAGETTPGTVRTLPPRWTMSREGRRVDFVKLMTNPIFSTVSIARSGDASREGRSSSRMKKCRRYTWYIETKWGRRQVMIGARTFVKSLGAVDRPKERVVEVQGDHVIHCPENVKDIREGYIWNRSPRIYTFSLLRFSMGRQVPPFFGARK